MGAMRGGVPALRREGIRATAGQGGVKVQRVQPKTGSICAKLLGWGKDLRKTGAGRPSLLFCFL
jgi:hypothetical protein